jgi:hypothetical protein
MIYGEEAENKKRALDRAILSNSITQSELTLEKERANVLADIALRRAKLGPNASSDAIKNIEDERAANVKKFEDERAALNITNQGKREAQDLTQSLTTRQLAYAEVFKQSFSSMADAIVEFAKTGKFSFKNLISSMLEGLLRYELQLQAMAMYSMARPGLMNLVGGLFGFAPALAAGAAPSISTMSAVDYSFSLPSKLSPLAKGGVYDTGLQTFAKGGMFTNSIVSSPTLFKFAKGTGLMGEAGPEAIMPLKRDGNGNLGVRSNQGKVDVVVNNYSTQQATTKETMDSRGNRRIEVIVGDMVAGELNRVGSNTQQAMTAGYGTSPLLARR